MAYTPPSGTNANLIFSGSYTAPTASSANLLFEEEYNLYQIWTDSEFLYAATSKELDIYDLQSENLYAYLTYSGGFTSVWANDNYIFLGTSGTGIKYISKNVISGSITNPPDLYLSLEDFSSLTPYYELTNNVIKYLHGYGDIVLVITDSGIDIIKLEPQGYRSSTIVSGVKKGFMTSTGKFYYTCTTSSGDELNWVYTCLTDWSEPDVTYSIDDVIMNDIFITEGTATNGYNTIFVATSSGVYEIDEYTYNYNIYYTR